MRRNNLLTVFTLALAFAALAVVPALAQQGGQKPMPGKGMKPMPMMEGMRITKAVCVIHPIGDSKVGGTVVFTQTDDGIKVEANLKGLSPGDHGFHIHQYGDCSAADGTSAGGHFNPDGAKHGGPDAAERHEGDLGNISADASGLAEYSRVDKHLSFHGPHSIIGRAIIVHAKGDDLTSQPTGAAGARVGCGVIGIAKP